MKYAKQEVDLINNALKLQATLKSEAAFEDKNSFEIKPSSVSNYDRFLSSIGNYRKERQTWR